MDLLLFLDLSKAQKGFSTMMESFKLRYIGEVDVDDDYEYGMYAYSFCL